MAFDRNSGDFWVVSLLAYKILERLTQGGPSTTTDLQQQLEPLRLYANLADAIRLTLQSLTDNGLVTTGH